MSAKNVAVAGATGAVGVEMLKVLEDRGFPVKDIRVMASERSVGRKLKFRGQDIVVEELAKASFKGVDIALFSAGGGRSKEFAPRAAKEGALVIDNSSAFRMDPEVPLVIPEINAEAARKHKGIIANPNCTTIIMAVAVYPIHKAAGVKRLIVASYQATSGAGQKAMQELDDQVKAYSAGKPMQAEAFPYQIAFNVLPHIGNFLDNGYTEEEMKLVHETHKIFGDSSIRISGTTVRVPVFRAHSEAVFMDLEKEISVESARKILSNAPGIKVVDEPSKKLYPMPLDASGQYDVLVGRIRKDTSSDNGLAMWVAGDQLLKGAALNAVQIAELFA
ncbi:MAG TPA: aspartate-semialdehyde dehydrogenase [Planctomycetes bacterium]|nr:aspartate-semialdehyde dehydrogenase [Planctomycetota bacterium]